MTLGHDMTIPAQRGGLGTEPVGSPLARLRVDRRDVDMAPAARIRLRLAGLKLIVGVEGTIILRHMTAETELQRIGSPTATQQALAGRHRLLLGPAILGNIMATEAGQRSPRERKIAGNPPCELWTWPDIDHVSLTSCLPPIMTRLA
jgi:hypothetical protein